MAEPRAAVEKVKEGAGNVAEAAQHTAAQPWVEAIARIGYFVRGVLYAVVGLLAVQVALGRGGQTTDKNGAIEAIGAQPFGKVLLGVVVVGLVGYSLWGFIRAVLDPLDRGIDPKGIATRLGYAVSGLSYGALVIPTVRFITGTGEAGNGSGGAQSTTASLLSQPFGPWLVVLVGLVGMGGGLGQFLQAFTADFKKDFKSGKMSANEMTWATRIARFGLCARGVVFLLLGFFVVQAGLQHDPKQTKGLDGALQTLAQQRNGPWLLGLVALGLVSFGVYSALCARWIRI